MRQNEFLVWQGRGGKKSLRQVFLFEDLVLFSKARRFPDSRNLDIYIYKNSIKTSDIGLTEFVGESTTKFEIWFRKRKPDDTWTLQSVNEDIKRAWAEEVSRLLWKQAKRNRDNRMAEMSSMGIGSKPCLSIRPSQNQINDRSVRFTQLEKRKYHAVQPVPVEDAPSEVGLLESIAPVRVRDDQMRPPNDNPAEMHRPNSTISLGSSISSGTSRSSASTTSSSNSNKGQSALEIELDMINEAPLEPCESSRKCQRSTTSRSQYSIGEVLR